VADHDALVGRPRGHGLMGTWAAEILDRDSARPGCSSVGEELGPANRAHLSVGSLPVGLFGSFDVDAQAATRIQGEPV
jgi:hypothetical protein